MRQQFSEKQTQRPRLGNLREEGQMVVHIKFERCKTFARQYFVQCTKTAVSNRSGEFYCNF